MTTQQYQQPTGEDTVAALIREIRLLVDMVVEHSAPWLEGLVSAGHGQGGAHAPGVDGLGADGSAQGGSSCGWCPFCMVVAIVRGERPEFSARALEQATQLVALLRAVLADRWYPEAGVHMPGFHPEHDGAHRGRGPTSNGSSGTGTAGNGTGGPREEPLSGFRAQAPPPTPMEETMPMPRIRPDGKRVQRIAVRKVGTRDAAGAEG